MKQVLQNLKSGATILEDVPCPSPGVGEVLIRTKRTLVSAGTERMLVNFGKANLIAKARQQPDKVKQVIDKVKTDGLAPTLEAVRSKLDQPLALGYCNVGIVEALGKETTGLAVGDRVVSNGKHAEYVCVPQNLCAKIPDNVGNDEASFTVISAIALQGIRLIRPTLGECVLVIGLGLIGLVTVQLLRANGCRVMGLDFDSKKVALARALGATAVDLSTNTDPFKVADAFSRGCGVDAVLITASTTSNEPIHQAATMCRKRGRIVLVGVVGMEMSRADFYEKELSFQVSCSYGPGRYDPEYEERGRDYPYAYVRWTEQRNFEAVLDTLAAGSLDVTPLVSHRFKLDQATEAYNLVSNGNPLGILLDYEDGSALREIPRKRQTIVLDKTTVHAQCRVGFIGSGNYATQVLIPAFSKTGVHLHSVSCKTGISGVHVAKKFNISEVTTDTNAVIESTSNNIIVITTRHDSHADLVCDALQAGKHVFVEKPLAITRDQLQKVRKAYEDHAQPNGLQLAVGFNRRFSPLVQTMREALAAVTGPLSFVMTVNAGNISFDHWTQNPAIGGGRIIGEACHFVDLLASLAKSPILSWDAMPTMRHSGKTMPCDNASIQLAFENGSIGTVHYLADGSRAYQKERLEVFGGGGVLQINNFKSLKNYGWPNCRNMRLLRQDKGNAACAAAFIDSIKSGSAPIIPFTELYEVSELCLAIADKLDGQSRSGHQVVPDGP